ncbi:helix-turn-helix domain-containing protein [Devriesea agamarum]|uniref:helix-turn-helix domain-containing protein n=1 Tax=Devriesea agamarum TaxID=472569 RepID=UPI00071C393F
MFDDRNKGVILQINTLPIRLRAAREYANFSQEGLAERAGIGMATVSRAERGDGRPTRATIRLWAWACGIDAEWLRTGKPEIG